LSVQEVLIGTAGIGVVVSLAWAWFQSQAKVTPAVVMQQQVAE
jgi:hypothetical protein